MDENRAAGSIEEVKDAIGWAVSDTALSDGEADKAGGKIQNYGSGLNAAVRDAEAMRSAGLLVVRSIKRGALADRYAEPHRAAHQALG